MAQIPPFASYRDPTSSISSSAKGIVRNFETEGASAFRAAHESGVLRQLVDDRLLIDYEIDDEGESLRVVSPSISFVSYPSEWTFGMLKEAALLTLEVTRRLWSTGFHLRDASAYNVVFDGNRPKFVDLGSVGAGTTPLWNAYGQFCDHFLNPLLIEAKIGIPFRDVWTLDGVPVATTRKALHGLKGVGSGAFRNVVLRAGLESSLGDAEAATRRSARTEIGLSPAQVEDLMARMAGLIDSLEAGSVTHWTTYSTDNSYGEAEEAMRDEMIRAFSASAESGVALDIGTNTGRHAAVLAESHGTVIALDSDASAIEAARARFDESGLGEGIYPLVADIAAPTPGVGLMNQERAPLLDRLSGVGAVTWMAVIHHLVIGRSIPLEGVATLAARLAPRHLIEFVDMDDPMSQLLSASKGDVHHPYDQPQFEKAFGEHFNIRKVGVTLETRPVFELTLR